MRAGLQNGESRVILNGVDHWCKIGGLEHQTIPLIVIHGGPSGNQYVLERTIGPMLEEFATVIYYEQRGCGRSAKPNDPADYSIPRLVDDVEQLREYLQVDQIRLLGVSFGSEIAMEYALAFPNHVDKLVLQGPVDGNWERLRFVQYFGIQHVASDAVRDKLKVIFEQPNSYEERRQQMWDVVDHETIAKLSAYNQDLMEQAADLIRESMQFGFNEDYHSAITTRRTTYPRLIDRVRHIQAPTLIVVGLHDRHTGIEMSRDLMVQIPNSKLVILENSAHYPDAEEPDKFLKAIMDFMV